MSVFKPTYKDKTGKRKKVKKWWVELRDHTGIVRRFAGFTEKTQTAKLEDKIRKLVVCKINNEPPDRTLSEWLEQVPAKLRRRLTDIGLLDSNRAAAGKPLLEHLADFEKSLLAKEDTNKQVGQTVSRIRRIIDGCKFSRWSDISASTVQQYLSDLRSNGENISAQTFNFYLSAFRSFCQWMVKENRASQSSVEHLKGLNVRTDRRHDRRALSTDELRRLLQATQAEPERFGMSGPERASLYRFAVESGLRANELRTLKVSSFDLTNCTVTVEAGYSKHRRKDVQPLNPDTIKAVKPLLAGKLPDVRVFKVPAKTSKMIQKDLAAANIPFVKDGLFADFHALRHTYITNLRYARSRYDAQALARHQSSAMTDRYMHIELHDKRETLKTLPNLNIESKQKATGTD